MKKFFVITTVPITLGFFTGNLKYLSSHFEVCAISSKPDELKVVGESEGVRTHCIPMERPISLVKDIVCLFQFILFFIKERPYVVHGNTPKAAMLSMVAAWLTCVPVRIYMCHGLRYQGTEGKMRKLLIWMEKLTCACATEVICVSKGVRETFAKDGICALSKSVVLGDGSATGLDLDFFNPSMVEHGVMREELGLSPEDFVFIFVGRIVTDKGINELVDAFDRLSSEYGHAHLVLVGAEETEQNPITEHTRGLIERNGNIHAIGRRSDVRPYLADADAFVLPSYREGFGMVLIEANAMGIPAISTDIIGCNEVVLPGENGELVPARDADSLYTKMKEWIDSPEKVRDMAQNCRKLVEQRFDRKMVWKTSLEEYQRLVREKQ